MGMLFVLYDWSEAIDWKVEEAFCVEGLRQFGRPCERFVYSREKLKPRVRKTSDSSAPLDGRLCGFGAYNFGGGEVNLPAPQAQAVTYLKPSGQKVFLLFIDDDGLDLKDHRLHSFILSAVIAKTGGYGFAQEARRNDCPEAIALGASIEDVAQSAATNAWRVARREAAVGDRPNILRNIFSLTILPTSLLSRKLVEGATLAEWIEADPRRGRVEPITPKNAVWSVAPENVNDVRVALRGRDKLPIWLPR